MTNRVVNGPLPERNEEEDADLYLGEYGFNSILQKKNDNRDYPPESPPGYSSSNPGSSINDLENILSSFLTYMKISGLFFDEGETEDGSSAKNNRGYSLTKLFCLFTVTVNWLVLMSYVIFFLMFTLKMEILNFDQIPIMICAMTWHIQNAINATVCYRLSSNGRFRTTFYRRWATFHPSDSIKDVVVAHSKKLKNYVLYICLVINIVNSLGWILGTFEAIPGYSDFKLYPLELLCDDKINGIVHRIWGITAAFTTPAWTLLLGLFCVTCSILNILYDNYNAQLKSSVESMTSSTVAGTKMPAGWSEEQFPHNIELFRLQYEKINKMVECADENFSFYLLTTVLTNMVMLCSNVYHSIYFCSKGLMKVISIFWTATSVINIGMVCYFGAWLNESAHEALSTLHGIPNENLPLKRLQQITMFINRLSGPLIGFTGWGFFILSKDLIMSLVSTFFTYFFLLVQFGSTNNNSTTCA